MKGLAVPMRCAFLAHVLVRRAALDGGVAYFWVVGNEMKNVGFRV